MKYLNELRDEIYEDAAEHGLWETGSYVSGARKVYDEAKELLVEAKNIADADDDDEFYKSVMAYEMELADVIIMSLSVAGRVRFDIADAVRRKMEINKNRPYQHKGESK